MRGQACKHASCRGRDVFLQVVAVAAAAVTLLGLLAASPARSEDLRVEASVDSRNVGVGGSLTLTLTVYGGGKIEQPDLSSLGDFQVVSSYSSQNISIVNARMTKSVSLQYVLVALREGDFTLGPFTVRSGNATYETEPIEVTVTARQPSTPGVAPSRTAPSQTGRQSGETAIRAFASADKKRAYVGEQITYTQTFAYRADVQDASFQEPEHTGFWSEPIGQTSPEVRVIDGVQYYAISRTTAFFPISSGRFTIGQAGVRYLVDDFGSFSRDPFSLFSRDPFRRREGVAATDPIQIEVLPLPSDGRPSDFSGAVGDFRLRVVPSADEIRVGESVTLSVRIEGRGNIKSISEIPLPKFDGFRVFAPKARDSVRVEQGRIGGAKIFDLVLVPEVMGSFSLAGITLSYFDPVKGAYVRKDAEPVELRVLEGDESTMRALAATGERRMARQDIRHIKRVAAITDDLTLLPAGAPGGFLRVAPLVAALAGVVVMLQRRHMATTGKAKVRRAFKDLLRDLDEARRIAEGRGTGDASALISRAIRGYIARRKASSESLVDACYVGSLAEISAERRAEISDLLSILDQARFAPAASGAGEMVAHVARAEALMKKVDGEWRD